jgi:hypothetical protein
VYPRPITTLGEFFDICEQTLKPDTEYWFRGHADSRWTLTPSALRYPNARQRNAALNLLATFKRYAETTLPHAPAPREELKWVQIARHYGLPTRLLDWTRNAAVALYFACMCPPRADVDGAVFRFNPVDLNRNADLKNARILDAHSDARKIAKYLTLSGRTDARGPSTIAINPAWNSERILRQQGAFTLHGSREFTLTAEQAPSLVCWRVPGARKQQLLRELERAGTNEMTIFPEPEHICRYLVWKEKLDVLGVL